MASLKQLALIAAAGFAQPAAGQVAVARTSVDRLARWQNMIFEAAARFGLPASWIERVMRAESGGATTLNGAPITSPAGAMGLMQLMPGTWARLRATYRLGADPFDPHDNIIAGAAYLSALYDRFGYPGLFAAYNAGPGRYAAYLAGTRPLPRETRGYLAVITGVEPGAVDQPVAAPRDRLFAIGAPADHRLVPGGDAQSAAPLFVIDSRATGK